MSNEISEGSIWDDVHEVSPADIAGAMNAECETDDDGGEAAHREALAREESEGDAPELAPGPRGLRPRPTATATVAAQHANVEKRPDGAYYVDGLKVSTAKLFRVASPMGDAYKATHMKADKADMSDHDMVTLIRWVIADSAVGLAAILAD